MPTFNTEFIVIKRFDFGEKDRIITVLSPEEGKFSAIAKGVKRPQSRLAGGIEIFTHAEGNFVLGKSLHQLTQLKIINSYSTLRNDLEILSGVFYLLELISLSTFLKIESKTVFSFILGALERISVIKNMFSDKKERLHKFDLTLRKLEMDFLKQLGYQPELFACCNCHKVFTVEEDTVFRLDHEGFLCTKCTKSNIKEPGLTATQNDLKVLRFIKDHDWARCCKLNFDFSPNSTLALVIGAWLENALEKHIKSREFLEEVRIKNRSYRKEGYL